MSAPSVSDVMDVLGMLQHCAPQTLFNPWRSPCIHDARPDEATKRLERLHLHLSTDAKIVLCGEAMGYAGGRFSGIAFTSEFLLYQGSIPRLEGEVGRRITSRHIPFKEMSATIVWRNAFFLGIAERMVTFNAVPWHPHRPDSVLSNRTPTERERAAGIAVLERLLSCYPEAVAIGVGNTAASMLDRLGVEHVKVRHPANGGAALFGQGLKAAIAAGHGEQSEGR